VILTAHAVKQRDQRSKPQADYCADHPLDYKTRR